MPFALPLHVPYYDLCMLARSALSQSSLQHLIILGIVGMIELGAAGGKRIIIM